MKLNSISLNHHKILGSIKINFFGDSKPLKEDILKKYHTDIHFELKKTNGENNYTYIIGQNGIGKTLLFKSIIHSINWNSQIKNSKIDELINFYRNSNKYRRIYKRAESLGFWELWNIDILNTGLKSIDTNNIKNLEKYNAQIIFISSSFEKSIIHKNPRFRSFNYTTEMIKTNILFLKALIKFYNKKELSILNNLLDKDKSEWTLQCGLSNEASGGINKKIYTVLLKNENNINISNFLKTLKKIKVSKDNKILIQNLNSDEKKVFEEIYHSNSFFKLYYESNYKLYELFENIQSCFIIKTIEDFLFKQTDSKDIENTLNIRIRKDQLPKWDFLISKPNNLTEFDSLVLGLLESLNLVDINILCNGVSIDKMSSGEQSIIRLFSFFSDLPVKQSKDNLLVFFDEPENNLHPKWQQNFPVNFKRIVEEVYQIKNSHFIFATHSPLIIMKSASILNSNVLHFDKSKDGSVNSQQVNNINSFSIEELLLDEFKISYRDREIEIIVENLLKNKKNKLIDDQDPIYTIEKSFDLREKIDDLYNKTISKK